MEQKTNSYRIGHHSERVRDPSVDIHIVSGKVRSAYYEAYSSLSDLQDAARDLENERIERDALEALNHLQHIYDELEDKYEWD